MLARQYCERLGRVNGADVENEFWDVLSGGSCKNEFVKPLGFVADIWPNSEPSTKVIPHPTLRT